MPADRAEAVEEVNENCAARGGVLRRGLLLDLGTELLGGGFAVYDVERVLRRLGTALGAPKLAVAAFPTGLFLALTPDTGVGFRAVTSPLRCDQTAQVVQLSEQLTRGHISTTRASNALAEIRATPPQWPTWVSTLAMVPIAMGLCVLLAPSPANVAAAAVGSIVVAVLSVACRRWTRLLSLLPVTAAFVISLGVLVAAQNSLLDDSLRTIVAVLAVLLPGSLLVTGLSEIASGATNAGSGRLVSGAVQLTLFIAGVWAADALVDSPSGALSSTIQPQAHWWISFLGVVAVLAGVIAHFDIPIRATPHIAAVMAITVAVQLLILPGHGAALAGLIGAVAATVSAKVAQTLPGGPPWQVIFLPSFWVLVPGSFGLINTVQTGASSGAGVIAAATAMLGVSVGTLIGSAIVEIPLRHNR